MGLYVKSAQLNSFRKNAPAEIRNPDFSYLKFSGHSLITLLKIAWQGRILTTGLLAQ